MLGFDSTQYRGSCNVSFTATLMPNAKCVNHGAAE